MRHFFYVYCIAIAVAPTAAAAAAVVVAAVVVAAVVVAAVAAAFAAFVLPSSLPGSSSDSSHCLHSCFLPSRPCCPTHCPSVGRRLFLVVFRRETWGIPIPWNPTAEWML